MVDADFKLNKMCLIQSREGQIHDYYDFNLLKDVIGSGGFASVVKAKTKEGNATRAIKILRKQRINDKARFKEEVEILKKLDHPHIVKLYESFEDGRNVYLVTELCKGGELFDRIVAKGHFTEAEAKKVFREMLRALNYCHSVKICYRDLKPENFVYVDEKPDSHIKLIDFGLAKSFEADEGGKSPEKMTHRVGTAYYIAPEVLDGPYDESCDIWSAGVILYILLCGVPPFNGKTDGLIADKIREGKYSLEGKEWVGVSDTAKDLIRKMMCPAASRLKASEVLNHPWLSEQHDNDDKPLDLDYQSLKSFTKTQKLKRIAMLVLAAGMSEEEISELSKHFNKLDKNGDGVLTFEEMQAGLGQINDKTAEEVKTVMQHIDIDKNGFINYSEFITATMERSIYLREDKLLEAFKKFDRDGNGKITAQELKDVLEGGKNLNKSMDYYNQIIKEVDTNGDGMIDYKEFVAMMQK